MPRWMWGLLAVAAIGGWLALRGPARPATAEAIGGGGAVACALPPAWRDDDNPRQSDADGMPPFRLGRAQVTPLAGFSLEATVLSRKDYSRGAEAEFSPTDLALGWGPMAAPGMADALEVTQGGRWYRYRWDSGGPPMPPAQIVRHSANMHMVPADALVARDLDDVEAGDTVELSGWLVRIERDDGWKWQSSTRRDDSGNGSCELVYVCRLRKK
jgi:hypothetical protein